MFCAVFPLARFLVSVCIGSQQPWNLATWAPLRALNALKAGCRSFSVYISAACQPATPAGKAPHHLSKWGRTEVMVKGFWITGDLESESKSEPQIFSNHASPPFLRPNFIPHPRKIQQSWKWFSLAQRPKWRVKNAPWMDPIRVWQLGKPGGSPVGTECWKKYQSFFWVPL